MHGRDAERTAVVASSIRSMGGWATTAIGDVSTDEGGCRSDAGVVGDRVQRDMIVGGRERPGGCREQVVAIAYGVGATVSAFRGRRHGSCRGLSGFRHDGS